MKTLAITTIVLLFILPNINAQISGKVFEFVDNKKEPLFGVNVYWENSSVGTSTDFEGRFEIQKPSNSGRLIFSFVGYASDTIIITENKKNIDVTLSKSNILKEVVIGERQVGTHYSRMETMSVQNISGAELCKAACCNLSESFETNASVDASYSDAATGAKQIKLLGLAGRYVQMMTENIPNLYGLSQPYALGYIPGPWMESIQVSKGTSAVINGYEAITGQINVEYKKPNTSPDKLFVNLFGSSAGRTEANIDGAFKVGNKWSSMILAHAQADLMDIDHNNDSFMDMPAVNQYNLFNRWDYFGNNITFRTGIKLVDETRKGGQSGYNFNQPSDMQNLYGIYIKSQRIETFAKLGYVFPYKNYQSIALISNFTGHTQNSYYGKTNFDAEQTSLYFNLIWQSVLNGNEDHKYNAGISLKNENLNQTLNDSTMKDREIVPGAYFQYTGHLFDKANVILGLRADYHNQEGLLITPRLNLRYNISGNIVLRGSVGKGFRKANVLAENNFLLASSRNIHIANDLKLEEAWNYGANLTWYIPIGKREMTVNFEFYRTQFINQIIADFETFHHVKFYNLDGKSYSNTYQVEATFPIIQGLDMTAALRYNDVKQTIDGNFVESPLTNRYKGIVTISYKTPLEKWQFDFTAQFNGGGRIPVSPTKYNLGTEFPAYNIFNAQITKYFKKWEMYIGAENLFDFTQKDPIISVSDPYGNDFDSALIWGPIHSRKIFLGIRFAIK
jgi:outer membrane cobalamin receptor